MKNICLASGLFLIACATYAQADDISNYIVDVGSTPVSAGDLVGLSSSAITNIQSAHDLSVLINPLTSGPGNAGFGLALTPARTKIKGLGVSLDDYVKHPTSRLWGATTISYAENSATISGAGYKKSAWSVSTTYIFGDNDPVIAAYNSFLSCQPSIDADTAGAITEVKIRNKNKEIETEKNRPGHNDEDQSYKSLIKERDALIQERDYDYMKAATEWKNNCQGKVKEAWNESKVALSFGSGWIKPDATPGTTRSLGTSLVFGGVIRAGTNGAVYLTVRRTIGEVDLNTLSGTPTFSSHSLGAMRFTQGLGEDSTLRALAEVSNANAHNTTVTTSTNVFKYAIGIDKNLADGVWVEFRVGRNRTIDGLAQQTTSLLTLNWSPTSTLPAKSSAQ